MHEGCTCLCKAPRHSWELGLLPPMRGMPVQSSWQGMFMLCWLESSMMTTQPDWKCRLI